MPARRRDMKSLAWLLPTGALGVSVALASAAAQASPADGSRLNDTAKPGKAPVSERLQAIRDAVSTLTAPDSGLTTGEAKDSNIIQAWWGNWHPWGNWGWHPGWGNGWHNGGWGNWHNAPWGNWHNYWHNW
jgi:rSAM-associated Gly-rich repeat protein